MPDPSIQPAIDEIAEVLRKHDLGGLVFVGSKTHTQFLYALTPSWSCIRNDPESGGIRIKARSKVPAEAEAMRLSVGLIAGLLNTCTRAGDALGGILKMLGQHMGITHIDRLEDPGKS